jgi:HPt (histidine-containing phosphotransfer) domain-containing protein
LADPSIDELLALARAQFAAGLGARVSALADHVEARRWQDARRAAHKLRGAAATYAFTGLGAGAGAIEEALIEVRDQPGADVQARVAELLVGVQSEARRAAGGGP